LVQGIGDSIVLRIATESQLTEIIQINFRSGSYELGCTECRLYALDFEQALKGADWSVASIMQAGALPGMATRGIALVVHDPKNLSPDAVLLLSALRAARIEPEILRDQDQGLELLFTPIQ